ncbi:MAG TPA: class A beta-lactamase [Xanthobacteraceae bacterium]|jgi:beta-lactamase class A|nr:class A beta-lactamase [Xanthobacteraceae bacterium]
MPTRRHVTVGLSASLFGAAFWQPQPAQAFASSLESDFAAIEAKSGGRLGVAVLDTASGARADHRGNERFPLCSTFKVLAVSAVLKRAEAGREHLDRRIAIKRAELIAYSPVLKDRIGDSMTLAELCAAAMTESDNTAADLVLKNLGGPTAVTAYARALGDTVTHLDNSEPLLNRAKPFGLSKSDTTSPSAMVNNLQALILGDALAPTSRDQLKTWLLGCKTGDKRLRAGLPEGWQCGDKTGSDEANGSTNDVGVLWPPQQRPPVIVAAYLTQTKAKYEDREAALADVGRAVVAALG